MPKYYLNFLLLLLTNPLFASSESDIVIEYMNTVVNGEIIEAQQLTINEGDSINIDIKYSGEKNNYHFGYHIQLNNSIKKFDGQHTVLFNPASLMAHISWIPSKNEAYYEDFKLIIYLFSDKTTSAITEIDFSIKDVNTPPTFIDIFHPDSITNLYPNQTNQFIFQPSVANDNPDEVLIYDLEILNDQSSNFIFDRKTGKVRLDLKRNTKLSYLFKIVVYEQENTDNYDSHLFRLNLQEINFAPQLRINELWQVKEGVSDTLFFAVSDDNSNESFEFNLTGNIPPGLDIQPKIIDQNRYYFCLKPNYNTVQSASYKGSEKYLVNLNVRDKGRKESSKTFTIEIKDQLNPSVLEQRISRLKASNDSLLQAIQQTQFSTTYLNDNLEKRKRNFSILGGSLTLAGAGMGIASNQTKAKQFAPLVTAFGASLVLLNELDKSSAEKIKNIDENIRLLHSKTMVFNKNINRIHLLRQYNTEALNKTLQLEAQNFQLLNEFEVQKAIFDQLMARKSRLRTIEKQRK